MTRQRKARRGRDRHSGQPAYRPEHGGTFWIYGRHAVAAAIGNQRRRIVRVLASGEQEIITAAAARGINVQAAEQAMLAKILPADAVHQGVACEVYQLTETALSSIKSSTVLVLDQITDPHNIGAILRSAAAFDAGAVVVPMDNYPNESGVMAKAASGALDIVPVIRVTNLAQALRELKTMGYWCLGLDGSAEIPLSAAPEYDKVALVLGAEGKGLRRLTRERCDITVMLPMSGAMESLNVSNAAAVALYELFSKKRRKITP